MKTKLILGVIGSIYIFLFSVPAVSSCSQSDLVGAWYIHGSYWDGLGASSTGWYNCKVKFKSSGRINTSSSICYDEDITSLTVIGGRIDVENNCRFELTINTCPAPYGVGCDKVTIVGQVNKNKNSLSGTGYYNDDNYIETLAVGNKR